MPSSLCCNTVNTVPIWSQIVSGHACQRFNGIAQTRFGEPIVCRHLAAHAYETWLNAIRDNYTSLESIENTHVLATNMYDRSCFFQQKNMIICSLSKIGRALQYSRHLDQNATVQRLMVLVSSHAMCLLEHQDLSQVTLYDPNETNSYYEVNNCSDEQLKDIGSHIRHNIPAMRSYMNGIESLCLLTERQELTQSNSRLLRCWTQEPYEALGWCLRQSEALGAKAVIKKFASHNWSTISPAQADFLAQTEHHLSDRDQTQFRSVVYRSAIPERHKMNIINNCFPIHGRSAA